MCRTSVHAADENRCRRYDHRIGDSGGVSVLTIGGDATDGSRHTLVGWQASGSRRGVGGAENHDIGVRARPHVRGDPSEAMMNNPRCRRCGARRAKPTETRHRPKSARWSRCVNAYPSSRRAKRRYEATAGGRRVQQRRNRRRIYSGSYDHGMAATVEQGEALKALIATWLGELRTKQRAERVEFEESLGANVQRAAAGLDAATLRR